MKLKCDEVLDTHIYKNLNVTPKRVAAFGDASYKKQLEVLAHLRGQVSGDDTTIRIAVYAMVFSLFTVLVAPRAFELPKVSETATLVGAGIGLFIVVIVALSPVLSDLFGANSKRERASVWLGAFEDEIQRRRSMTGFKARKWKSNH